jgi:hypothetical protein
MRWRVERDFPRGLKLEKIKKNLKTIKKRLTNSVNNY